MGDLFRTCQDGHRCENGSVCVEAQEGSFYCDCETATGGDFVGLSCEFGAEQYCRRAASPTADWFCANQGACVELEVGGAIEWKCDCLAEYEGPHCEYIKGAKPDDWPGDPTIIDINQGSEGGLETWVMIVIIAVSALVVSMLACLVVRKMRSGKEEFGKKDESFRKAGQNAPKDQSEALQIEMDGSGFRHSVLGNATMSNGTEKYDFESAGVEVDSESGTPQTASFSSKSNGNSNGHGNGHGMML